MYLGDSDINRILTLLVANAVSAASEPGNSTELIPCAQIQPEGIDRRFKEEVWLMKVLAYGHKGVYNRHFAQDLQITRLAQTLVISFADKRSPTRRGVPASPYR